MDVENKDASPQEETAKTVDNEKEPKELKEPMDSKETEEKSGDDKR
jgi:hypothetical protein